jgi:hypothetical protein
LVLTAAGLLDGCRATTHWARCGELAERHPGLVVDEDAILVREGRIATSGGEQALRVLGVPPGAYRGRFGRPAVYRDRAPSLMAGVVDTGRGTG